MQYNNKKIIIYGKNRYQRDFQYIFNHLGVSYYIDDDAREEVAPINSLQNENPDDIFVIVCKAKNEQEVAFKKLEAKGLVHSINYCLADELFQEFDYNIEQEIADRKIAVWGTGSIAKEFYDNYKKNYEGLNIDLFIDSDISKSGKAFYDKKIVHINDINDWNSYYIIIAIADYKSEEINRIIDEKGIRNNSIQASRLLMGKPSELLKRTIYDTNQYKDTKCSKINDMRILKNGSICPCCSANGFIMGNVFLDKPEDVWESIYEKIFRLSILNETYTFCDGNKCQFLVNRIVDNKKAKEIVLLDNRPKQPYIILFEMDGSCNIMCSSCRDNIIIEESEFYECLCNKIIDKYLDCSERIIFTGNGEALASKYGKRILQSEKCMKRQHISILTNGFAFNNYNWNKYFSSYQFVDVSVSIDAASEETYLKLRRKSNWNILNDNLQFIKKLKSERKIGFFQINFVVQKSNVHEMDDFVRMGKKYNVDRVLFNWLENWNYTQEEFANNSIMDEKNLIKDEYKHYFLDVILSDEIVDFTNIAQAIGKNAKNAYMY